jgi:3-hydroxybutyryl-CoA dehydrogenase
MRTGDSWNQTGGPEANPLTIGRLAIVGAGTMGQGIAQVFAQAGWQVTLTDSNARALERATEHIATSLKTCATYRPVDADEDGRLDVLERIIVRSDLAEAVFDANWVVEAVFEDLELKRGVLGNIEEHGPAHMMMSSTTSSYCVRDLAVALHRPERFLVTHFWNPAYLIPIVEVMPGDRTCAEVVEKTSALLKQAGKIPALIKKDVPGFVGNRLQHALRREAIAIVAQGIASPRDVDLIARLSFGLRLPIVGPLETVDLGGLDLTQAIQSYLLAELDCSTKPSQLINDKVARGEVGAKAGKGFYDWNPDGHAEALRRRDSALLEMVEWVTARGLLESMSGEQQENSASQSREGNNGR